MLVTKKSVAIIAKILALRFLRLVTRNRKNYAPKASLISDVVQMVRMGLISTFLIVTIHANSRNGLSR